jgi:hypothetical protein
MNSIRFGRKRFWQHFPKGAEENRENPQSGWTVSQARFERSPFRIPANSVTGLRRVHMTAQAARRRLLTARHRVQCRVAKCYSLRYSTVSPSHHHSTIPPYSCQLPLSRQHIITTSVIKFGASSLSLHLLSFIVKFWQHFAILSACTLYNS